MYNITKVDNLLTLQSIFLKMFILKKNTLWSNLRCIFYFKDNYGNFINGIEYYISARIILKMANMSELFKFDIEILDMDKDVKYTFKNCDRGLIEKLTEEENILKIRQTYFFNYGLYDKIRLLDENFMVMKSSKKNIILIKVEY